jgi:hypothetical protein
MFGYWLRRVDARFQLEQSFGSFSTNTDDAVARLERLFAQVRRAAGCADQLRCAAGPLPLARPRKLQPGRCRCCSQAHERSGRWAHQHARALPRRAQADSIDEADNPDYVPPGTVYDVQQPASSSSGGSGSAGSEDGALVRKEKSALRRYIERFDQATMVRWAGAGAGAGPGGGGGGAGLPGRSGVRLRIAVAAPCGRWPALLAG